MNTFETTAGNAYTTDPDYAAFSGRLVRTSSTVHYDPKVKAWIKRTVEWIDVGRAEQVKASDPDTLIDIVEILPKERVIRRPRPQHMRRRPPQPNTLEYRVVAYLKEFGPMPSPIIADELGLVETTLRKHLNSRLGHTYQRKGNLGRAIIWGLLGVE